MQQFKGKINEGPNHKGNGIVQLAIGEHREKLFRKRLRFHKWKKSVIFWLILTDILDRASTEKSIFLKKYLSNHLSLNRNLPDQRHQHQKTQISQIYRPSNRCKTPSYMPVKWLKGLNSAQQRRPWLFPRYRIKIASRANTWSKWERLLKLMLDITFSWSFVMEVILKSSWK